MLSADAPEFHDPKSQLSADAPVFQYHVVPARTKLTARAQLFKSAADPHTARLNKAAPLFQPAALKAEISAENEKIMWISSRRWAFRNRNSWLHASSTADTNLK